MLPRTRPTLATVASLAVAGTAFVAASASVPPEADRRTTTTDTIESVLAISIDGLNPAALEKLGSRRTPHLHAFRDAGASTLNARTEHEQTITLPNHTGMVTGRRIDRESGGHGVTWNDDRRRPRTVQAAAGRHIHSVFTVVHDAGGSAAFFANKTKFSLWKRSWGKSIDRAKISLDAAGLVRALTRDLVENERDFRLLHIGLPDAVGHDKGFMSRAYLRAVRRVDALVGDVLATVESTPHLAAGLATVLTSDHGGLGDNHSARDRLANYRVPFMVRGPGVTPGSDLYELNPELRDPGVRRTAYSQRRQPVRNGDLANLALDLLDLPPVPGSEHNSSQELDVS